jgi:SRSO17 transposase
VIYRKKTEMALAQVARALGNGIRVAAWTYDAFYGRDSEFLDGMEALGQNYVGEAPCTFTGWLHEPEVLIRPTPEQLRNPGRKPRFSRLSRKSPPPSAGRNLATGSRVFQKQKWQRFPIKDGENGPMIWEVKHAPFFRKRGDGLPGPGGCLIVARNVLNPDEVKYFVSNLCPGSGGVTINWLLWVGFSRWPIERCFEQAKIELGMDHFEVRGWRSIHRHLYITQLSHLFCARVHQQLREKNDADALPDGGTSPHGRLDVPPSVITTTRRAPGGVRENGLPHRLLSTPQPTGSTSAHQNHPTTLAKTRHQTPSTPLLCAA